MVSVLGATYVGQIICTVGHKLLLAKRPLNIDYEQPETNFYIGTPIVAQDDCNKNLHTLLNHGVQFHNKDNFVRQKEKERIRWFNS